MTSFEFNFKRTRWLFLICFFFFSAKSASQFLSENILIFPTRRVMKLSWMSNCQQTMLLTNQRSIHCVLVWLLLFCLFSRELCICGLVSSFFCDEDAGTVWKKKRQNWRQIERNDWISEKTCQHSAKLFCLHDNFVVSSLKFMGFPKHRYQHANPHLFCILSINTFADDCTLLNEVMWYWVLFDYKVNCSIISCGSLFQSRTSVFSLMINFDFNFVSIVRGLYA